MTLPQWWVEGATKVISKAKKYVKWSDENAPRPDKDGIFKLRMMLSAIPNGPQKKSPVFLLESDCRKLIEWIDGGK